MLLLQYIDINSDDSVELHKEPEGYILNYGKGYSINISNESDVTTLEEVCKYFFDIEFIWEIEKIIFVEEEILDYIFRSRLEYRNIYLEMLQNIGFTYLNPDEYNVGVSSVIRDLGAVLKNEFYNIHSIELININTSKVRKAYGYLDKNFTYETKDTVVEVVYDFKEFNEEHVAKKIEDTKEIISDIKSFLENKPNDIKGNEDLIRCEKQLIYLQESFLSDLKSILNIE